MQVRLLKVGLGTLAIVLAAGTFGGFRAVRTKADDTLGIPMPVYADATSATRVNVAWINTVDEAGGTSAYFNLRYRLQSSTPDIYSSYTYIGGGGPPDDLSFGVDPSLPTNVPTHDQAIASIDGLNPSTSYCFSVRAFGWYYGNFSTSFDYSPWSGDVCATTRAAPPTPTPVPLTVPGTPTPSRTNSSEIHLPSSATYFLPTSTPTPAPTKPDLDAVSIGGPATFTVITNQVYTATIRNDGAAANGNVEVAIGLSGVLQAWDTPVQTIGLSCSLGTGTGANTWTCEGGTLASGQTATIQFPVHASSAGKGTIVLSLNPSRALDESDYSNNLQILNMTAK